MKSYNDAILPPATIGILGGGQLGQMMAFSAKQMGYKVGILDPTENSPAGQVSDFQIISDYDDENAVKQFAKKVDILTYEFENVDQDLIKKIKNDVFIPQKINELEITSNRIKEKFFLRDNQIPVVNFQAINNIDDLVNGVAKIGYQSILKSTEGGYDGHAQYDINNEKDLIEIKKKFDSGEWILEEKKKFQKEVSMMVVRNTDGKIHTFPLSENIHKNHILHKSIVPARVDNKVIKDATDIAKKIAERLDLIGILGIEFFLLDNGSLVVNELAPRPHNSGHYTIEACNISQFEAHIRSICNIDIPDIVLNNKSLMVNLLGEDLVNARNELPNKPNWHFHDYGKDKIKPARKMGHITLLGNNIENLLNDVNKLNH
ncbi:5-(carboxyamino)imidazole ribonucleotide synthase [Lactobacillus sp. S2-2]|uniref:5-(carboxyamino)imidazole ribonucleotide synthase n=1 Tax=Lactobacillus sp. S2-2 TaxID=2692917 RepID=UPI001EFF8C14|nr:5-(carboxyamino)imidazole ribonucleotide synthase [Lactobacillus sp. S2-2]MCF6515043.1 5-(carboxyamino)imidazole ribonucleotide synthase [Lactobacillus sp. S2-2]